MAGMVKLKLSSYTVHVHQVIKQYTTVSGHGGSYFVNNKQENGQPI